MTTIAEPIKLPITPEDHDRREEIVTVVSSPLTCPEEAKQHRKYECHVLNFLYEHRDVLGIQTVFRFQNLLVDGAVLLVDGTRLAVEIKLRMNWTKACRAGWEFQQFLKRTGEAKANPVSGAIVFFEEFQGDGWEREAQCRVLQNSRNAWYTGHANVEGYRVDLFRLSGTTFVYYALAEVGRMIAALTIKRKKSSQLKELSKNNLNFLVVVGMFFALPFSYEQPLDAGSAAAEV